MKLINRDKFINDMFDLYLDAKFNPREVHFSLLDVRRNIDSPEYEVEAITVEWIENYISKIKDDGMVYLNSVGCIKDMIKEWRKENAL